MRSFEKYGLVITCLFLVLLSVSFCYAWLGADLNVWLWICGVGLVGSVFSIVYFFVPIDAFAVKGKKGKE